MSSAGPHPPQAEQPARTAVAAGAASTGTAGGGAADAQRTAAAAADRSAAARVERRAAWRWGSLVVGFLTLQLIIGAVAVVLATGDASVAVVPDYHHKALHWDRQMELRRQSHLLGWQAAFAVDDAPAGDGRREIRVRLTDARGGPVDGAAGQLQLYHHARAGEIQRVRLGAAQRGQYVATAVMPRAGLWELELTVRDDAGILFAHTETISVGEDALAVLPSDVAGSRVGQGRDAR